MEGSRGKNSGGWNVRIDERECIGIKKYNSVKRKKERGTAVGRRNKGGTSLYYKIDNWCDTDPTQLNPDRLWFVHPHGTFAPLSVSNVVNGVVSFTVPTKSDNLLYFSHFRLPPTIVDSSTLLSQLPRILITFYLVPSRQPNLHFVVLPLIF